tara:strand:- start:218 stop:601 length:384 start_codon:yes stop_codon:yes gene_type:complete
MNNYIEIILLGILLILVYKKPAFLHNLHSNKIYIALLILLNLYLLNNYGITSGIVMALIIIILIDKKENFCDSKEGFVPKIKVWKPASFTQPCQLDLDRNIKLHSEKATINSSKQLDSHTNGGYKLN